MMLICLLGFITSFLGIVLKLFGERDYSKWLIMSIAENPTQELFIRLGISVVGFLICILIINFSENDKGLTKRTKKIKR